MKPLTGRQIEQFASRVGVKRIAVENFLVTLYASAGEAGNLCNLKADAKAYKWNTKTVAAIRAGIKLAFKDDRNPALSEFIVHG